MIKWIGQHIWDFTSRFRADVYFEELSSTKNHQVLLIDENEKVTTLDSFLFLPDVASTYGVESSSAGRQTLFIGEDNNLISYITKKNHSDGAGGKLSITAGSATATTSGNDAAGGNLILSSGRGTGGGTSHVTIITSTTKAGTASALQTTSTTWDFQGKVHSNPYAILNVEDDFALLSQGNMMFGIDSDNNETSQGWSWNNNAVNGAGTPVMTLNEGGDLQVDGTLQVDGSTFNFDDVGITAIQTSAESFADNDTSLMTSAAIEDRFASVGGSVDLTSEVTGALPVANGGTGATSLTDNKLLTGTGTSAVTAEANATYDGTDFTLLAASQYKPILKLHNQHNSEESPELLFLNQRGDDASVIGGNGDEAGKITFKSINGRQVVSGGPEDITYAQIKGSIKDATDGGEEGQLDVQICQAGSLVNVLRANSLGFGTSLEFADGSLLATVDFKATIVNFESSFPTGPVFSLKNMADDATGPQLMFIKDRDGTPSTEDNDELGRLTFRGYDSAEGSTDYAEFYGQAVETDSSNEAGKAQLTVMSDGQSTQRNGITCTGHTTVDKVDVDLGYGAASTTTVAGDLSITTGLILDSVDVTTIQTSAESFADNDTSLMTSAAIDDRINAAGGGVSVSDSTANTDFPVVFHDESNNLHDDTGTFTYNPSTGNAVIPKIQTAGNIELGHASDTTLARSASGKVTIEGNQIVTSGDEVVSTGNHILKQTKVTIDTAGFNGLNSTPVELVAAQGANKVIVPTEVVLFHDRAATNTNATDLIVGFNGLTSYPTAVKYTRRYMQNITTDRTMTMGDYARNYANDLTTAVNSNLTIALSAAPTTNCVTSLTVYTSYYVIDIS